MKIRDFDMVKHIIVWHFSNFEGVNAFTIYIYIYIKYDEIIL